MCIKMYQTGKTYSMNHTIVIEKIIPGGKGLGRLNSGIVVLSPYVLPGEKVVVRESKQHRGYIEAELVDILEPSLHRVIPACPYFTRCGGCDFQHIKYHSQQVIKKEIILESLERSKAVMDLSALQSVIPSPKPYHYRFRIRLKLSRDGRLGFYKTRSNSLVEIDRCLIATDRINTALQELNNSKLLPGIATFFREIELLQSPADDLVHAVVHAENNRQLPYDQLAELAASFHHVDHLSVYDGHTCVPVPHTSSTPLLKQDFAENICGQPYTLTWSPDCFFQVNAEQNSMLVKHALQVVGQTNGQRVLDLYCGMGNFSIPFGLRRTGKLTGIEINRNSMAWAEINARTYKLQNCRFIQGDVIKQLSRLIHDNARYDILVLDPPRQGVGRKMPLLADLKPDRILYVSCDPATLMRDMAVLTDKDYTITTLIPVDMFPQTHHIESVALLEKN